MRRKMNREHTSVTLVSAKHLPGGLIDIEFVAQLGILASARLYPRVLHSTGTLSQLNDLMSIGWLTADENRVLQETTHNLRQQRMMASLVDADSTQRPDTNESAVIFKRKMGESSRPVP
jgi:glutamine synthetase adenylyltransferase